MPRTAPASPCPTVIDGSSLFDATEVIGERFGRSRTTLDYSKLYKRLNSLRTEHGWHPASISSMILSMDPSSEGQQRFQTMLSHSGFEVDVVHFREAFFSMPPGRSPNESSVKSQVALASRIAYITGLMAQYPTPELLVVSHSFELYGPLIDLAERVSEGKVGLAYFASLLDDRWRRAGLFDGNLDISFFDLDPFGQDLFGIDILGISEREHDFRSGLKRF